MLSRFYSRGLHMLVARPQQLRMIQQGYIANQNSVLNTQMRAFAKKKSSKKGAASEEVTEEEPVEDAAEPVVEEPVKAAPEPVKAAPVNTAAPSGDFAGAGKTAAAEPVDKSLFGAFSVDVKQVQTTEDHKAPLKDDSVPGRYAEVLFTTASQQEILFTVYEDMEYIKALYDNCESFRLFTQNGGVGSIEMGKMNVALKELGSFNPLVIKFLEVLAENKRLFEVVKVCNAYAKLYKTLNKEEKITIISAEELSGEEKSEVLAALSANPNNAGKDFTIDYTLDPAIKGGLQMYTETEFMDMSLVSRIEKLKVEINKMSE